MLPDGARRSPDAAWTLKSRILELDPENREGFWHLCPDFVIEVRSKTDRIRTLREKMQEWISSGAQLAWSIDPETREVEIYRRSRRRSCLGAQLCSMESSRRGHSESASGPGSALVNQPATALLLRFEMKKALRRAARRFVVRANTPRGRRSAYGGLVSESEVE